MSMHTLKYKLCDEGLKIMAGCAANNIIEEQGDAISNAFSEINVTIEVDDDWGICKLIAINNYPIQSQMREELEGDNDDW